MKNVLSLSSNSSNFELWSEYTILSETFIKAIDFVIHGSWVKFSTYFTTYIWELIFKIKRYSEIFRALFLYEHKHIGRFSNLHQCTFNSESTETTNSFSILLKKLRHLQSLFLLKILNLIIGDIFQDLL